MKVMTKPLENYAKNKDAELLQVVKKHAFILQANTAGSPAMPVDTGALKNSINARQSQNPKNWIVSDGTDYGIHQELGTRFIPARHFMGGAAEKTAPGFFSDCEKVLKNDTST
jgi:HK97 gp10 family phage protein